MSHDVKVARLVDATPEEVFDAFTNPDGEEVFYGQDDPGWIVRSRCDLHIGGAWTRRLRTITPRALSASPRVRGH
jgi:uncharacterized protein YndB with AHSA1/START domain